MEPEKFTRIIAEIIKKARAETVRCAEDHVPVNLTLDYISEDIADHFQEILPSDTQLNREKFLHACGFSSW